MEMNAECMCVHWAVWCRILLGIVTVRLKTVVLWTACVLHTIRNSDRYDRVTVRFGLGTGTIALGNSRALDCVVHAIGNSDCAFWTWTGDRYDRVWKRKGGNW